MRGFVSLPPPLVKPSELIGSMSASSPSYSTVNQEGLSNPLTWGYAVKGSTAEDFWVSLLIMFDWKVSITSAEVGEDWRSTNGGKVFTNVGNVTWLSPCTSEVEEVVVFLVWVSWHSIGASKEIYGSCRAANKSECKHGTSCVHGFVQLLFRINLKFIGRSYKDTSWDCCILLLESWGSWVNIFLWLQDEVNINYMYVSTCTQHI